MTTHSRSGLPWQAIACANPSPMTLEGTNTYLLGREDHDDVVVVDPGPDGHPEHAEAVLSAVGERSLAQILVTHRHSDHTGAAPELSARTGAPVRGFATEQCLPGTGGQPSPLRDGEQITAGGVTIEVLHTPGHTSDSVCLWLPEQEVGTGVSGQAPSAPTDANTPDSTPAPGAMLTGDTILGRGTTMLDHPDGTLSDYLATLERLADYGDAVVLPAHGPTMGSLRAVARKYRRHRQQRLNQTRELLAEHGELSADELGRLMYGERAPVHAQVITQIAAAQLDHLKRLGHPGVLGQPDQG